MADTPAFTRKWWDKNKPTLLGKTGMGDALAAWEKNCGDKPVKIKTRAGFQGVFDACDALELALPKARSKAGKDKKVQGWCDWYEKEMGKYRSAVKEEYAKCVERYEKDRNELLEFTKQAWAAMVEFSQEMKKLEAYMDSTEDEATDDLNKNGGAMLKMYYDQAQPAYNKATRLKEDAAKRYEKDGKYIKERRGGSYNAESYGVLAQDNERLSHIFVAATENTNKASAAYKELADSFERLLGEYNAIVRAFFGGQKGGAEVEKDAEQLAEDCEKLVKAIEDEIFKTSNTFPILERFNKAVTDGKLKAQDKDLIAPIFTKLEANEGVVDRISKQLQAIATKGLKRIPPDQQKSRKLKPTIDRIRMALMQAVAKGKKFKEKMATAREQAKAIASAPTVG
ncbi:MAG: hypothetical protein AB7Q97_18260 [Gammaproteobacteria bacterium]